MPKVNPDEYVSVGTAAKLADVTRAWMRQLAATGKVRAFRIENQWFVRRSDAEKFSRHPTAGRPRE
jgi:hypothetical protein